MYLFFTGLHIIYVLYTLYRFRESGVMEGYHANPVNAYMVLVFMIVGSMIAVIVCLKEILPHRTCLHIISLLFLTELFCYGCWNPGASAIFSLELLMFMFMMANVGELFPVVIGELQYFLVMAIHFNEGSLTQSIVQILMTSAIMLFCLINAVVIRTVRRRHRALVNEQLSGYRRRFVESEEYLYNISHELRTKLNIVSVVMGIGMEKADEDEDIKAVTLIQDSILRLTGHVDDILDFAEISSDRFSKATTRYSFKDMIRGITENASSYNWGRDLWLYINISPDIPEYLVGDELKIRNIINRLLEDAIRFTPQGAVSLRIYSRRESYGCNLNISVGDTGSELQKRQVDRIFMLDKMNEPAGKRSAKTGMGGAEQAGSPVYDMFDRDSDFQKMDLQELDLSLIRKLVMALGGFMDIELLENQGKVVRISIPQGVEDYKPRMDLKDMSDITVGVYMRRDKYSLPILRAMGRKHMELIMTDLKLNPVYMSSLTEVKAAVASGKINSLMVSEFEYYAGKDYLDSIKENIPITVFVTGKDEDLTGFPEGVAPILTPITEEAIQNALLNRKGQRKRKIEYREHFVGISLLLADNDPLNREPLAELLRIMGVKVETAASLDEAVRACARNKYDLILWNYHLPEMDLGRSGARILNIAGNKNSDTPVIAITSRVYSGISEELKDKGFADYMTMPVSEASLNRVLVRVVNKISGDIENDPAENDKNPVPQGRTEIKKEDQALQDECEETMESLDKVKVPILITTESACDLSLDIAEAEGIPMIPCHILTSDGYRFDDLMETGSDFIFSKDYPKDRKLSVEIPSVEDYREFFERHRKDAGEIIHISHMKFKDSGIENAREAARSFTNVRIVDSGLTSLGIGRMALSAARAARAGFDSARVMNVIEVVRKRYKTSILIGRTSNNRFSQKRLSIITHICNKLDIYPSVYTKNDSFHLGAVFNGDKENIYRQFVYEAIKHIDASDKTLVMGYIGLSQDELSLIIDETNRYRKFSKIITYKTRTAGAVIAGKGTVGFSCDVMPNN